MRIALALLILGTLLLSPTSSGQLVASTAKGVVVAHNHTIELTNGWEIAGVAAPTLIAASAKKVAVVDALNDEVVVVDLVSGQSTRFRTAASPIAALFVEDALYVLARDARLLQRLGGPDIPLASDPSALAVSRGRLYVYSRGQGLLLEIENDRITREVTVPRSASDLEVSGRTAYLVYPREGTVRLVNLETMQRSGELAVGAVPVDLAFAGGGTALTARILAVADPGAKRVWLVESTQSSAEAVGRGFLRGLLGLGLFRGRGSQFPTGIDRVLTRDKFWLAYDTASGTLYRFDRKGSSVLARGVAPGAYTLTETGAAWWNGTSVAESALR